MAITLLPLDTPQELLPHKQAILELFERSFNKPFSPELWEWFYLKNPLGAIVTVAYDDGGLIGHYALIPMPLKNNDGETLRACQSITTMVDSSRADLKLFERLANETYLRAQTKGYELVFGFPNQNSKIYFQRILRWQLHNNDFIALLTPQEFMSNPSFCHYHQEKNRFYNDNAYLSYRLSKPDVSYEMRDKNITKHYEKKIDLLRFDPTSFNQLESIPYYVLIDGMHTDFLEAKVFEYPFGGRWLDDPRRPLPLFRKEMLLSDVF